MIFSPVEGGETLKLEIDQNIIDKACSLKMAEYEKHTKRTWLILNHLGLRLGQQGIYMVH